MTYFKNIFLCMRWEYLDQCVFPIKSYRLDFLISVLVPTSRNRTR